MILRVDDEIVCEGNFTEIRKGLLEHLFTIYPSEEYARYVEKVLSWLDLVKTFQPGTASTYEYRIELGVNSHLWRISRK